MSDREPDRHPENPSFACWYRAPGSFIRENREGHVLKPHRAEPDLGGNRSSNGNPFSRGISQPARPRSDLEPEPPRFGFGHHGNPGARIEKIRRGLAIDRNRHRPIVGTVTQRRDAPGTITLVRKPTKLLHVGLLKRGHHECAQTVMGDWHRSQGQLHSTTMICLANNSCSRPRYSASQPHRCEAVT
jgi:hypothetical protein